MERSVVPKPSGNLIWGAIPGDRPKRIPFGLVTHLAVPEKRGA